MADITAIILTRNEEEYIRDCILSVKNVVSRIIVIDSFSTDKTTQIAEKLGCEVIKHMYESHAKQFIYALEHCNISSKWIMRIDADERLTEKSSRELNDICINNTDNDVNGIIIRFCNIFLGKEIKHGGMYPWKKLCVYKNGKGCMENRNMDEHIVINEGKTIELKSDSFHLAYRGLSYFINKSNWYSNKETKDFFESKNGNHFLVETVSFKSKLKMNVYYRLPMGFRAWLYYVYRYYFRFGFLDGKEGKIFFFLYAYWYRFLVDAKIYEHQKLNNDLHAEGPLPKGNKFYEHKS